MVNMEIVYTLAERETGEGLYIISTGLNKYITYVRNKEEFKNLKSQKELLSDELLKSKGIYLLKNVNEIIHNAEEKTKKIIKYIMINKELIDEKSTNSDIIKIFIIMLTTYLIYQEIFFTAIIKDPTFIDFFENDNSGNNINKTNERNIKLEILQNLFYYLLENKGLSSKLNVSGKYIKIYKSFEEIDKDKNIFNKETTDLQAILSLFNKIKKNFKTDYELKKEINKHDK